MLIHNKLLLAALMPLMTVLVCCKKLVSVPEPINSLTTAEVFSTDAQANSAIAGIYSEMINGTAGVSSGNTSQLNLNTIYPAYSSDEIVLNGYYPEGMLFNTNHLLYNDVTVYSLWAAWYSYIYGANAVIQGIEASGSGLLHDSVRKELTGEAKFVRAFSYFYLVNLFGDVPLALTIDFSQTENMGRTSQSKVYEQIIQDCKDAQAALPADYSVGQGERIRPNKWAATALLARVYLYRGDPADAAAQAGAVIGYTGAYSLVSDVNGVFLKNSMEAIWQLQQNTAASLSGTATPDGLHFLPNPINTGFADDGLSTQLLGAFEPGDQRRLAWIDSTNNLVGGPPGYNNPGGSFTYFPYKYKTGAANYVLGGVATEYYMMLRLAEMYLVRAEAEANGAPGGSAAAIADLNVIRARAGLAGLPSNLSSVQVSAAIAHERQTELFCEWGHRWLDLKRTGQAHGVLSQIALKQPWAGDYQLLYPVPYKEILFDHNLVQNTGYN